MEKGQGCPGPLRLVAPPAAAIPARPGRRRLWNIYVGGGGSAR